MVACSAATRARAAASELLSGCVCSVCQTGEGLSTGPHAVVFSHPRVAAVDALLLLSVVLREQWRAMPIPHCCQLGRAVDVTAFWGDGQPRFMVRLLLGLSLLPGWSSCAVCVPCASRVSSVPERSKGTACSWNIAACACVCLKDHLLPAVSFKVRQVLWFRRCRSQ